MIKDKRKHFLVVSDAGVMDKASRILEIKGSTLCYSEKDLMWKDTKSYGIVELVPGWRPGKKAIQEARVRVATLKSQNYLGALENLVVKLEQFKRLTQNSAFMPSLKEKVLENYFDKNFDAWRNLISPFYMYKDRWIDINDKSLESKISEKRREIHMISDEIREVFHPSGELKKRGSMIGAVAIAAGGTAHSAFALAKVMRNKMTKKEK